MKVWGQGRVFLQWVIHTLNITLPSNFSLRGLAFKNNCYTSLSLIARIRLEWMWFLNRFFFRTCVMVALVHVCNLPSALNEQQNNSFIFLTLEFKCESPPPPLYRSNKWLLILISSYPCRHTDISVRCGGEGESVFHCHKLILRYILTFFT